MALSLGLSIGLPRGLAVVTAAGLNPLAQDLIILAAGQSNENATSSTASIDPGLDTADTTRVRQWVVGASSDTPAVQALTWPPEANNANRGPAPAFAMAQTLLPTMLAGSKIIIIPAAVPGTALVGSRWAAPSGDLYVGARDTLAAALAAYPGAGVIIRWTQGEADSGQTQQVYSDALRATMAGFRAVSGASATRILICQMVPERFVPQPPTTPGLVPINLAHRAFPLLEPNALFVGADLGYQTAGDPAHFTPAGARLNGQRAAAQLGYASSLTNTIPGVPFNLRVEGYEIAFEIPASHASSFILESRAAGSSDTFAQTEFYAPLFSQPGTTVRYEPAGNSEVRVRARSYAGLGDPTTSVTTGAARPAGLPGLVPDPLFSHSAADTSGQNVPNTVPTPADGTSAAAYNLRLGGNAAVDAADPTFVAAAGGVPAMLTGDGADRLEMSVPSLFLRNLSNTSAHTFFMLLKPPAVWSGTPVFAQVGGNSSAVIGESIRYILATPGIRIMTSDGTAADSNTAPTGAIPVTGYAFVMAGFDPNTGSYRVALNKGASIAGTTATAKKGTATSGTLPTFFSSFPAGSGFIEQGMFAHVATEAEVASIISYLESKYAITIGT